MSWLSFGLVWLGLAILFGLFLGWLIRSAGEDIWDTKE